MAQLRGDLQSQLIPIQRPERARFVISELHLDPANGWGYCFKTVSQVAAAHHCKTVNNVIAHLQRLLPPEYQLKWNRPSPAEELAHPYKYQTFTVLCVHDGNQIEGQVYPNDFHSPSSFEVALNRSGTSPRKVRPNNCTADLVSVTELVKKLVPCRGPAAVVPPKT